MDEAVLRGLALTDLVRRIGGAGAREEYQALATELNVTEAMHTALYLACSLVGLAERLNFDLARHIETERRAALGVGA
jgi:hypothetical protein